MAPEPSLLRLAAGSSSLDNATQDVQRQPLVSVSAAARRAGVREAYGGCSFRPCHHGGVPRAPRHFVAAVRRPHFPKDSHRGAHLQAFVDGSAGALLRLCYCRWRVGPGSAGARGLRRATAKERRGGIRRVDSIRARSRARARDGVLRGDGDAVGRVRARRARRGRRRRVGAFGRLEGAARRRARRAVLGHRPRGGGGARRDARGVRGDERRRRATPFARRGARRLRARGHPRVAAARGAPRAQSGGGTRRARRARGGARTLLDDDASSSSG